MPQIEVILRLNAMGDILLVVPTLRELEKLGIETHMVIHQRWSELAEFLPARIHLFSGTGSILKLASQLKSLQPDAIHDLQGKLATIALRIMIKANRKTVYKKREFSEQLRAFKNLYPLSFADQRPVWQKYADTCGVKIEKANPLLNLSKGYLFKSKELINSLSLIPKEFLLFHPDASKSGKIVPAKLVDALVEKSKKQIVLIGTGSSSFNLPDSVIDLRNKITLNELPGLMSFSAGLISADSGPMHLARAVDIPVVAIFVQTDPSLGFSPVPGKRVLIVSKTLPCKPCSLHGQREICPEQHFACKNLDPEKTASEIHSFLAEQI